jgi:hypothetical protein
VAKKYIIVVVVVAVITIIIIIIIIKIVVIAIIDNGISVWLFLPYCYQLPTCPARL